MALPSNVVRSYGGGAVAAQLVNPIGPTDTSFGITTTVGWTEPSGMPLGTSGPFTVVIDRFTATVEKILCSAVNLTTGIVTVWTAGGSGRGYDQSTAQAHVPGGSPSGVQTTWSAVEAAEANDAVAYLFGTKGGTPANGDVLSWESGAPLYQNPSAVTGISLFDVGPALVGTPPARLSGGFLPAGGTHVQSTNASGGIGYNYDTPFPNGVLFVLGSVGDLSPGPETQVVFIESQCTAASWGAVVTYWNGTIWEPLNTGGVRINWFAVGF